MKTSKSNPVTTPYLLGVLSGVFFMIFLENVVNLFLIDDLSVSRFIFVFLFGIVTVGCGLKAYGKV